MKTTLGFRSLAVALSCFLAALPTLACEDNVRAKIQFPGGLKRLSVQLTSRAAIINDVAYYISSGKDSWCAEEMNMKPNCDLPKVIFISNTPGKVSLTADQKSTVAAIEFIRLFDGEPVLQIHEMKAPLNAQGFHEFKTKGSVKGRIYGRMIENEDELTWSMTANAVKFDPEYGDEAEDFSEAIEVRHEQSHLYNRAIMHPSVSKVIQLSPSWNKDWNLNCVEGLFSYEEQNDKEDKLERAQKSKF
jgi:hypothetical protein